MPRTFKEEIDALNARFDWLEDKAKQLDTIAPEHRGIVASFVFAELRSTLDQLQQATAAMAASIERKKRGAEPS